MNYSESSTQLLNYKKAMLNDYLRELNEERLDVLKEIESVTEEMSRRGDE